MPIGKSSILKASSLKGTGKPTSTLERGSRNEKTVSEPSVFVSTDITGQEINGTGHFESTGHSKCLGGTGHFERAGHFEYLSDAGQLASAGHFESQSDYVHLKPIFDSLPASLTSEERSRVTDLVCRYKDIFSTHDLDLGKTTVLEATIDIGPNRPKSENLRRYPRAYREKVDDETEGLLRADIIEEASSPYNSNLVIVKKRDSDKVRVTVDLRKLNECCYLLRYPLPFIKEVLEGLSDNLWFSCMDISHSFLQVPLREEHRDYTAFSTRKGQWRFKRMPQGFLNSSSIFSRLMNLIMRGLTYTACLCYIDDVIVFAKSFDQHLINLEAVFERLRKANLKLKPSKCKLLRKSIKVLGHVISAEGMSVHDEKIEVITSRPFPRTTRELRSFIGMANYYRHFCPNFSIIAAPLFAMLEKDSVVEPTEKAVEAFESLKLFLTSTPVLALPDDEGQYVLDTDASEYGCGAVLQQYQNGKLHVIEYASRTFNKAERKYSVTRKEMAAVIFALRHFRVYLIGVKFKIRVDHAALTHLKTVKDPSGQQSRQLEFLSRFNFDIEYRPGKQHVNADYMSRIEPCEFEGPAEPCEPCNKRVTKKCKGHIQSQSRVARVLQYCSAEDAVMTTGKLLKQLSREMSYLLRHGAVKKKLCIDKEGFVDVCELLQTERLKNFDVDDVCHVVEDDVKQRFALRDFDGVLKVRANQGHSIQLGNLHLRKIVDPFEFSNVFHGTYLNALNAIEAQGLSRMRRNHIHFMTDEMDVKRGVPRNHEVDIYVDMPKAMADGFQFYVAENDVILCSGDEHGCLPDVYFKWIVRRCTRDIGKVLQVKDRPQRKQCKSRFRRDRPPASRTEQDEESSAEDDVVIQSGDAGRSSCQAGHSSSQAGRSESQQLKRRKLGKSAHGARFPDPVVGFEALTEDFIRQCQLEDIDIAPAMEWVEGDDLPKWDEVKSASTYTRALHRQFDSLELIGGILYRRFENNRGNVEVYQLILPRVLRSVFLSSVHCDLAAHLMMDKCVDLVQQRAWWYGWRDDLSLFIKACTKCASYCRSKPPHQASLHPMTVGSPFTRWALDLTGPHRVSNGYTYIFTALDVFAKFLVAVPIRDKSAESVSRALVDHVFVRFGICREVLTDQGPEFMAGLTQGLLDILGVHSIRTTPYQPSTNGAVERCHRTLNSMIGKCVEDHQRDWSYYLPYLALAYNNTPHKSTGLSPFYIYHGRDPLWRIDLILGSANVPELTVPEYTQQVVEKLYYAEKTVRDSLKKAGRNMSTWHDKSVKQKKFAVGDRVRVYSPRRYLHRSPKWQRFYDCEAVITKCINDVNYIVKPKKGSEFRVHVNKLKPVVEFH